MESRRANVRRAVLALVVGAVAVSAPVLVLWDPALGFGTDYYVHAWMVGYQGEAWKATRSFAPVFNSAPEVGTPLPVFYGGPLYKLGGLLSAQWGCHVALRLIVLLSLGVTYPVVRQTARAFGAGVWFATATACSVCWATYGLTNVYSRTALPEFFANAMLTCSCCLWAQFFFRPGAAVRWPAALAAGLCLALAAATHPITGLLSVPVVGLIYVAHWSVPAARRGGLVRRHVPVLAAAALTCAVLAPWLYAYHRLGSQIVISAGGPGDSDYLGLTARTLVWVRLFPLPFDYNHLTPGAPALGTPHLDTQVSLPLLGLAVLALVSAYRTAPHARRRLAAGAGAVALFGLFVFALSVSPELNAALPAAARALVGKVQFAYRLVATVNIAFLILLLLGLAFRAAAPGAAPQNEWAGGAVALAVLFTLAACGLVQKSVNGRAAGWKQTSAEHASATRVRWIETTHCGAGWAYFTPNCVSALRADETARVHAVAFPVGTGERWGEVGPVRTTFAAAGYAGTQAVPFRWSTFRVDGAPVPEWELRVWEDPRYATGPAALRVAVPVPAGEHTVEYAFTPPRKWRVLSQAADGVLVGWGLIVACAPLANRLRRPAAGGAAALAPLPTPAEPRPAA
ncbi:hypothetical protein GobsT_03370 [Gemmata obscuriglobus]|uniref:Membrane protein 6-pyruvoyl-tetrahydropterin synthase-related domain-containing protein n=1 Tax=Gemmata obscuriglobus TaxID=114 RepID=A0A2Z3HGZ1_9BACT|nr:hypothetical protein [Gemmata obscuriglobus]AWM41064.1 hypothetical protein C1280_31475 [Gemmata obscuriglobus]QEG25610.1 hypothetical protein GobsT_03370 [Gemmata obscuriglobus]VTR99100.1 hypothetical protein : : PMT [Gemmata obscuriglobus UQM 2246]